MQSRFLEKRVEILERTMEELDGLPARVGAVETQLLQLRTEMRSEFSAVREEIRKGDEETRAFARVLHEDTIARIALIAEGYVETGQQLRTLKDQVVEIREDVSVLRGDVTGIRADVTALREDVAGFHREVTEFRRDVTGFRRDVTGFREDVTGFREDATGFREEMTTRLTAISAQLMRQSRRKKP